MSCKRKGVPTHTHTLPYSKGLKIHFMLTEWRENDQIEFSIEWKHNG